MTARTTEYLRTFAQGLLIGTLAGFAASVMGLCVSWAVWVIFPSVY